MKDVYGDPRIQLLVRLPAFAFRLNKSAYVKFHYVKVGSSSALFRNL
jgi:hypothetical protein